MNLPPNQVVEIIEIILNSVIPGDIRFYFGWSSEMYLRKIAYRFTNWSGCQPNMIEWENYKSGFYQCKNAQSTDLHFTDDKLRTDQNQKCVCSHFSVSVVNRRYTQLVTLALFTFSEFRIGGYVMVSEWINTMAVVYKNYTNYSISIGENP